MVCGTTAPKELGTLRSADGTEGLKDVRAAPEAPTAQLVA
jgi:hypothetical protein